MAHLDFKITSWKRVHIPDELVDEVIEQLKQGDVDAPYDIMEKSGVYLDPAGTDEECEEPMTLDENDGASTQELYGDDGSIIYRNGEITH